MRKHVLAWTILVSTIAWVPLSSVSAQQQSDIASKAIDRYPGEIRVEVDVVLLNATVTDPSDRFVTGLEKGHFRILEDKIEQELIYFSSDDVPASIGIILDVSGSMKDRITGAREAAATLLKQGSPDDEYFLIEFAERPQVSQGFTTDIRKLQSQMMFSTPKGATALYDAIYLGLNKLREGRNPRKALLVITDGEDNNSRYRFNDIKEFIKEQDVEIFGIGISSEWNSQFDLGGIGRAVIEDLVKLTGGQAFFPDDAQTLESACARIALELKSQYTLGYKSTNGARDGKWRKVRVEVLPSKGENTPKLGIRARNGYYAAGGDQP